MKHLACTPHGHSACTPNAQPGKSYPVVADRNWPDVDCTNCKRTFRFRLIRELYRALDEWRALERGPVLSTIDTAMIEAAKKRYDDAWAACERYNERLIR